MDSVAPLDDDIELLADLLDRAVRELSGDAMLALTRGLRDAAIALRKGELPGGRAAFHQRLAALDLGTLEHVARAFTLWFHLVNSAEEQHRIRVLRQHDRSNPAEDSLAEAIGQLTGEHGAADVRALLGRLYIMPVLTAHPTESRRRTVRDRLAVVSHALDVLERPPGPQVRGDTLEALADTVLALYATEESRATKPTPRDEVEAGLDVFQRTLLEVTPGLYRELEACLLRAYPDEDWRCVGAAASDWPVPSFLRWGSWIGGDRDGNPFVTAHVTRAVLERQRTVVLQRYLADADALGRALSVSSRRAPRPDGLSELESALVRDRERFPEVAARVQRFTAHEPWREKLWYVAARLRATLARTDDAYLDVAAYQRDLTLLERTLVACGYGRLAGEALRDCRRRAEVFGFHLASLDLRQHSSVHERAVDELLGQRGHTGYRGLDEPARCRLLEELLARPASLAPDARATVSPETQDLLATLDMVGRARRELGARACERYIVSFTSTVSDLLEVLFLERAAGLAPGELRPVPLLEQIEDLDRAGPLAEQMVDSPAIAAAIGGELEVMIGYSDSNKQVGYLTSSVALRRAQFSLAAVAERRGLLLTIFHGRGGAIGRGGGPSARAIRAQPERALRGRLRVTEQGETITTRYSRAEIAERDLEQMVSAVVLATVAEKRQLPADELAARDAAFDLAAAGALAAYQALVADPVRLAHYALAATPIDEVAALPIGSRPASRRSGGGLTLSELRAIPWVFSWNQSRHGVPGWFGLGAALATLIDGLGVERVRALYRDSPFFRALINNAQLALGRADIDVAAYYAQLADDDARQLFDIIRAEWDVTVDGIKAVIDQQEVLGNRSHLLASVRRRNPYVDVLSHTQVELLRRLAAAEQGGAEREAERERILAALFITINGIAAGLQTAG